MVITVTGNPTIDQLYPSLATRRDDIRRDWSIPSMDRRRILPCRLLACGKRLDLTRRVVTRHPFNDRHYQSLVKHYSDQLRRSGYDNDDAGPICLIAASPARDQWLAIGGATRSDCVVLTGEVDPENEFLQKFIGSGGFDATYYSELTPIAVVYKLVEELNVTNGLGVCTTFMQRISYVSRYANCY